MKKILLISMMMAMSFGAQAYGTLWQVITSLNVPTDSTWKVSLRLDWRPDTVYFSSQKDTLKLCLVDVYKKYDPDEIFINYTSSKVTIIAKESYNSDTVFKIEINKTMFFNPVADKITLKCVNVNNWKCTTFDSVIYGDLPNAILPSLGGSRTYHRLTHYHGSECSFTEDGKPSVNYIYFSGKIHNTDGSLIVANKIIGSEYSYWGMYASYSPAQFKTISFTGNNYLGIASDWSKTINYLQIDDRTYKIKPFTLTGKCGDTIQADIYLTEYVAVAESQKAQKFSIMCANKTLTMQYQLSQAAQLAVYNAQGQIVVQQNVEAQTNNASFPIDGLSAGVYFCTLSNAVDGLESLRFVVE